ncbi:MAG: hypothetical protein IJ115_07550 [Erysipelotrichaceae bacterium]|nr:hypothetical protein [Erysipelotrichaceae bacterium]
MKRILVITVALLVILSLVGCGASTNGGKTSNSHKIGEKIEANDFSVTVTKAEFTPAVETTLSDPNFYYPNPNEEKSFKGVDGKTYQSTGWASSGKVFLAFEIELIPNVKKDISQMFSQMAKLTYDGQYEFDTHAVYYSKDGFKWVYMDGDSVNHQSLSFEPLNNDPVIIRGVFEVPEEVGTSDKSLEMVVKYFAPNDIVVIR